MPIQFNIVLTETDGTIQFTADSPASPDATDGEIQYAKAFSTVIAAFRDRLTLEAKKPRNLKFQKRYTPPESPAAT